MTPTNKRAALAEILRRVEDRFGATLADLRSTSRARRLTAARRAAAGELVGEGGFKTKDVARLLRLTPGGARYHLRLACAGGDVAARFDQAAGIRGLRPERFPTLSWLSARCAEGRL